MNVESIIINQIETYNQSADKKIDLSAGNDTVLFGRGSVIDSIDFVSLIIDIEQAVEDKTGKHVTLSDERAFSRKNSPFRTVATLADYINGELNG